MRLLLSCLLVVLATACSSVGEPGPGSSDPGSPGGSVPPADEAAVSAALAAMYAGDDPDAEDRREGECFAEELLAAATPAELREGGLLDASYAVVRETPTLTEPVAGRVADAQLACTDFVADATAAQDAVAKGGLDRRAYATCLREALDEPLIREILMASLQGHWDDPVLERLTTAQTGCAAEQER